MKYFLVLINKSYNLQINDISLFFYIVNRLWASYVCSFFPCALKCFSCFIVFLLTVIFIFLSSDTLQNYKHVNSFGLVMPVTTRSQARLLFNACNENHQVCMECSPVSTRVSGINQPFSSTTTVFPLNNTDFLSPSSFIPVRLQNDSSTSDPIHRSLSDELLISKLRAINFKVSKFGIFKFFVCS